MAKSFTRSIRKRCVKTLWFQCEKRRLPNLRAADRMLAEIRENNLQETGVAENLVVYFCRQCGHWHVGHELN